MNVVLPSALAEQVEWAVQSGQYFSKAEYIRHLVRQDLLRNGSLGEQDHRFEKYHRPLRRHKPRSVKKFSPLSRIEEKLQGMPIIDLEEIADGYKDKSQELPRKYTLKRPDAKSNESDDKGSPEHDE